MAGDASLLEGKRVLLIARSEGHFTYYQSIISSLMRAGATVALWYVEGWGDSNDAALVEFQKRWPLLIVERVPRRDDRWRGFAFQLRELRSYAWYLRRSDASPFYIARWEGYLPARLRGFAKSWLGRLLLRRQLTDRLFGLLERCVPPFTAAMERLRRHAPDAVLVSPANMRFSEEVEYLKACRCAGVPVAVLVQTWDSLTTKGFLQIVPDALLTWHDQHRRAAAGLHAVAADRIRIIGAPFFDKWLVPEPETRPGPSGRGSRRPYVVYLGSSRNIAVDEKWVVQDLKRAFETHWHPGVRRIDVLVRPHPANPKPFNGMSRDDLRVVSTALPQSESDGREFRRLASGALAVVGINTSGMIDTVILDCPTIALRLDEYRETQAMTPHFQAMVASGAMYEEASFEAAADRVLTVWQGCDPAVAGRERFRRRMIWPAGGGKSAGDRAAEAIAEMLRRGPSPGSGRAGRVEADPWAA